MNDGYESVPHTDDDDAPLCDVDVRLTEEEIARCLAADNRRSPARLWMQTGLLALMAVYWTVGYATDPAHSVSSLVPAAACVLLLIALWTVPAMLIRRRAHTLASDAAALRVRIYADRAVFGDDRPHTVYLHGIEPVFSEDLLMLNIGQQTVGIPRRLTGEELFARLTAFFRQSSIIKPEGESE